MRMLFVGGALLAAAFAASAQTEVTSLSEAQRLGCLVRPAKPPRYPQRNKLDHEHGGMRLALKFSKPDAKPTVEVLFNSAREDMQDAVYDYVSDYRLPCLRPEDGTVTAVQDFSFENSDRDPVPLPLDLSDRPPLCVVMPRRRLDYDMGHVVGTPAAEHLVAYITFRGDGTQPPEVKFVYSNGSKRYEQAVREWIAEYRMPCRTGQEKPRTIEQLFSMFPDSKRRYGFKTERFGLMNFLAMTREPRKLSARFDLNTMGCPFSVDLVVGNDEYPNKASVKGRSDPNKQDFLNWLSALKLDFKSEEVANDVFGSTLQVDVPCGVLNLRPEQAAGGG